MLDKLQKILYEKQILKVENTFKKEIKLLMRKTKFIDDIKIDDKFNTHIYRNDVLNVGKLVDMLESNTFEQLSSILGEKAVNELKEFTKSETRDEMILFLQDNDITEVELSLEIDKNSLSNGEKQIFIMALYYSLVQLCNHEIPFVIDTPFARIDTEHRENISKYFFSKLRGQVFVLSTNEEIDSMHIKILGEKILKTYMLENVDNTATKVIGDTYFEV